MNCTAMIRGRVLRPARILVSLLSLVCIVRASAAETWQSSVSAVAPGPFPPLRPLVVTYRFGWGGFTAASAEAHFLRKAPDLFELSGTGHTTGVVRALWRMDVTHHAVADANKLRPIEMEQTEIIRSKKVVTKLTFNSVGVTRIRSETKRDLTVGPTTKQLNV